MAKKVDNWHQYATCIECNVRRMVARLEWSRAAQPRCYACGGRLEVCKSGKSADMETDMRKLVLVRRNIQKDREP